MAYYVMREMNDVRGDGSKMFYPQMARFRMFTEDEFVAKVAMEGSGLSVGQVESVLAAIKSRLAEMMALGYSVKLRGLGTFSASLGLCEGREYETPDSVEHRNAQSIEVRNIRFKADKGLVDATGQRCSLERKGARRLSGVGSTAEERLEAAHRYLDDQPFMKVADYVRITGMSRSSATVELRRFRQDPSSGIASTGRGSHKLYVRAEKEH